ncbi:MAG: acetolactate synthase [Planctomycetaceae bacterium]|nr:acetolactate synthase [Planctomycetaceae bacterium]
MGFGDGEVNETDTLRGRDWPCLRQFCVFLENKVGQLNELLRHLERYDLRIIALSIVDSADCAIIRVMVNNFERGQELFKLSSFPFYESDVIGVELPDEPQPYVTVCNTLLEAEVNILYTYPLLYRRRGHGAIALGVEEVDQGLEVLSNNGHRIITENDLLDDDEYFS